MNKFDFKDFRNFFRSSNPGKMTAFDDVVKKQKTNIITPYITKESQDRMIQVDVFSELMANRIIFFGDEVETVSCAIAASQLLYMRSVDKTAPVQIILNSPGGSVYDGLGVYDIMQLMKKDCEISVTTIGLAASMGSILLQGGTRGKRQALPHSRVLIYQVLSGTGPGSHQATDIEILSKETNQLKHELITILSESSGKPYEEVKADCERDHWLRADECLPGKYGEFGLIDSVVDNLF